MFARLPVRLWTSQMRNKKTQHISLITFYPFALLLSRVSDFQARPMIGSNRQRAIGRGRRGGRAPTGRG